MASQLNLHHHFGEARMGRTNLMVPCGARTHSTCNGHPIINIIMGNDSAINMNFLNNDNPSHQSTKNNLSATLSGMGPNRASANLRKPFLALSSNQDPMLEPSLAVTEGHSQYPSSSGKAQRAQAPGTRVPTYNPEISTTGARRVQPIQDIDHQSKVNLSLFHMLSKIFPNDNHQPFIPSSTASPPWRSRVTLDGGNDGFHKERFPSLGNPISHLKSGPATGQASGDQVSHPNSENGLVLSNVNALSKAPPYNIKTETQGNLDQVTSPNHGVDPEPQAQRRRKSARRHDSKPYPKGPYPCKHCPLVFENEHRSAAHANIHYKDESPAERMKRREGKFRKRALRIEHTVNGTTFVPEALQLGKRLLAPPTTDGAKAFKTMRVEGVSY